ncbi:hypothetical protein LINGRAHAP2_LOCUS20674 [Linum grandiflorum]
MKLKSVGRICCMFLIVRNYIGSNVLSTFGTEMENVIRGTSIGWQMVEEREKRFGVCGMSMECGWTARQTFVVLSVGTSRICLGPKESTRVRFSI